MYLIKLITMNSTIHNPGFRMFITVRTFLIGCENKTTSPTNIYQHPMHNQQWLTRKHNEKAKIYQNRVHLTTLLWYVGENPLTLLLLTESWVLNATTDPTNLHTNHIWHEHQNPSFLNNKWGWNPANNHQNSVIEFIPLHQLYSSM
jgi:hypothetical protein